MVDNLTALRARDDLLAVAASWGALQARLRPSGGVDDSPARTAPASRPPIAVDVLDLLLTIERHARFLGQVLIEETHDFAPSTSTMPGLLVEVAHRYGHFVGPGVEEKTALDFCDEAHELRRKVNGAIARHEPPKWAGPCPEGECPGEIYLPAGRTDAKCRECGRVVGPIEWRERMFAAFEDRLMSLSEIVSALVVTDHKVPDKTVRTWAHRKKLPRIVEEPDLYRFADAWALAERRAERRTA